MARRISSIFLPSLLSGAALLAINTRPVQAQPPISDATQPTYPQTSLADFARQLDAPTLVTLHLQDVSLQEVLDEFEKQTGLKLSTWQLQNQREQPGANRDAGPRVTIDLDQQPYWIALRELSKASKTPRWLRLNSQPGGVIDSTNPFNSMLEASNLSGITVRAAPFLIVANSVRRDISSSMELKFAASEATTPTPVSQERKSISLTISAFFDPKLRAPKALSSLIVDNIVDENGKPIALTSPAVGIDSMGRGGSFGSDGRYTVQIPATTLGKRIARLRGHLSLLQPRKIQNWEVPDAQNASGAIKTIETDGREVRYTLVNIARMGNNFYVHLTYEMPLGLPGDTPLLPIPTILNPSARRNSTVPNWIRLVDAKGRAFTSGGYSASLGDKQGDCTVTFRTSSDGKDNATGPLKFVLEVPSDYTEIQVPFEFKDLPLP